MKPTFTTSCGTVIAAITAVMLGTASAIASATPLAFPASSEFYRSGSSPATAIRVASGQVSSPTAVLIVLPPSVVIDPTVVVGSTTPTPESPAIARKEATAALAQAKRECRRQPGSEQKSCLGAAQDDYRSQMADARSGN
jgi:hypothetical protein